MRKFLLIVSLFITVAFPLSYATAQDATDPVASPSPTIVQYKLPYPGMLPDNKFYKLKTLRDRIMLFLTSDPDKKAQQYLLMANKQILMSKMLVDKGNIALAKDTALKGEHQMTLMTFVFKNANRTPKASFLNEVKLATAKHQELLKEIIAKVPAEDEAIFLTVIEFSQRNLDQLQNLTLEDK